MAHLIKAVSCPTADAVGHWRAEVTALHADLVTRYTTSMRRKIDLQKAWRLAVRQAQTALEAHGATLAAVPEPCPFPVAEMVEEPFTFEQGIAILANSLPAIEMRR